MRSTWISQSFAEQLEQRRRAVTAINGTSQPSSLASDCGSVRRECLQVRQLITNAYPVRQSASLDVFGGRCTLQTLPANRTAVQPVRKGTRDCMLA